MTTLTKYRLLLAGFMVGVALSGATAFPLTYEVSLLAKWLGAAPGSMPDQYSGLTEWIVRVRNGLIATDANYPFIAYGTDWLAFAHLVIAAAYAGPWRDPVRNRFVLEWGMFCCVAVIPLALICGPIRGIPFGWTILDCAFGVVGFPPLWICRRWALQMEAETLAAETSESATARSSEVVP